MRSTAWVLDLDGVVRLGSRRIAGAPEAVAALRAAGHHVLFATNNSNDTIGQVETQLAAMGVPAAGSIVTSATAAAVLLEEGERVMVCGGPGVVEAVRSRGAVVVDDGGQVDTVVVGFHRGFDYERMTAAARAVLAGARLVGTNDDRTFPTPEGLAPAAGAILASIVAATEAEPVIAGKPHRPMAQAGHRRCPRGSARRPLRPRAHRCRRCRRRTDRPAARTGRHRPGRRGRRPAADRHGPGPAVIAIHGGGRGAP
jgi:HAD superfamily hydrolase (TIGR01450 family)